MAETKPMRVAVASDQVIFRRGLASLIASLKGVQLVGEARNNTEVVQLCELVEPDALLINFETSEKEIQDLLRLVFLRWPAIKVVCFMGDPANCEPPEEIGLEGILHLPRDISEEAFGEAMGKISLEIPLHYRASPPGPYQTDLLEQLTAELPQIETDRLTLSTLLAHYLPIIFPNSQFKIRIFPDQDLVSHPISGGNPLVEIALRWMRTISEPRCFLPGDEYPWGNRQSADSTLLLIPVLRGRRPVGGISLLLPRDLPDFMQLLPSIQGLAGHISHSLGLEKEVATPSRNETIARELKTAGRIQADILPEHAPAIPGWDIAAALESARETSGDFYDFIQMPGGNYGIVIADVTDKGMGAALFMALSDTLIRSYASRYPSLPALTMGVVNERILADTRGNMFVTAFYGVLEPDTGRLRYVNAGHPPPYLISTQRGKPFDRLRPTGMALGVAEKAHWQQKVIRLSPGDTLLLFTDGVTEANNPSGEFFGEHRLMEVVRSKTGAPARQIQQVVLDAVHRFVGDTPPQDDIALIVIRRKP